MPKFWANISSAPENDPLAAQKGEAILKAVRAVGEVPVVVELENGRLRKVGIATQYELRNEGVDLYAELNVCDNTKKYARAATVFLQPEGTSSAILAAILLSDRSREELRQGYVRETP